MAQLENLVQTENGPRFARTATYQGKTIEVATGYNIKDDNWLVHVYITTNGERAKPGFSSCNTMQAAFEWGFDFGREAIDRGF